MIFLLYGDGEDTIDVGVLKLDKEPVKSLYK